LSAHAAETNPIKLATGALFDLTGSASVGTLSAGQVSRGHGSIARQNWLPEGQQERGYPVNFSMNCLAPAEIEVRFEPKATATTLVMNPSGPSAFKETIRKAKEWSDYFGRPVHLGELGCITSADPESRARFYAAFRKARSEAGAGWAIWDWSAGFRYCDQKQDEPMPGMREALFGK